jgi:hypothetical protein
LAAVSGAFNQADLSWNASLGATGYIIKRAITSGGPYTTIAMNVTGTTFQDTGVFAVTNYYYVVSAVNGNGEGANSSQAFTTTLSTATLAPLADAYVRDGGSVNSNFGSDTTLPVKNDGGNGFTRNTFFKFDVHGLADAQSINLRWVPYQVDGNATLSYTLVTNDSWTESGITWNNQPPGVGAAIASVSGYTVGQQKLITVTAAAKTEAAGDGILSLKVSDPNAVNIFLGFNSKEIANSAFRPTLVATLTHVDYPIPGAPTNLVATAVPSNQINLSWTAASGASTYNIKRSTVSGGPYTLIAAGVQGAAYSDVSLQAGTTYYYVVSAINGTGEGANSSQANANASAQLAAALATNSDSASSLLFVSFSPQLVTLSVAPGTSSFVDSGLGGLATSISSSSTAEASPRSEADAVSQVAQWQAIDDTLAAAVVSGSNDLKSPTGSQSTDEIDDDGSAGDWLDDLALDLVSAW